MAYTTIDRPSDYFRVKTYSGSSSDGNAITWDETDNNMQPDWLWLKNRTAAQEHWLADSVRGTGKFLESNSSNAESSDGASGLASFDTNGFTVNDSARTNRNTMVGWGWKASGSTASNTDGSITSTVSASTDAGFSIVSYTGNQTSGASVGHGLGVAPKMILVKSLSEAHAWRVYHKSVGATKELYLNLTNSAYTTSNIWNDQEPTSSVFYLGNNDTGTNKSGVTYIAYCFAEKKGYSKFSSYVGNGSSDGTFCFTGFKPAFVLLKNADEVEQWWIFDNKRNAYDGNFRYYSLNPNHSSAEGTNSADANHIDFLSNGFKLRTTAQQLNGTSDNLIYMAFAESPFVNSNGVPNNAE